MRVIELMASVLLQTLSAPAIGAAVVAEDAVVGPDIPAEPDVWLKHAVRTRALLVLCLGSLARTRGLTVKLSKWQIDVATFRAVNALEEPEAMNRFLEKLGLKRHEFGLLLFEFSNYRSVFHSDQSDALLESRPSPVRFALGDAFACLNLSLVNNSIDSCFS